MTRNDEEWDQAYYVICLEHESTEHSLLFWRSNRSGYTSDYDEAGKYTKEEAGDINKTGRDIALTQTHLIALGVKTHKLLKFPLDELRSLKKSILSNKEE